MSCTKGGEAFSRASPPNAKARAIKRRCLQGNGTAGFNPLIIVTFAANSDFFANSYIIEPEPVAGRACPILQYSTLRLPIIQSVETGVISATPWTVVPFMSQKTTLPPTFRG
ncbi:MAG TPA: hypothetical protein VG734_17205 [Lacunisphaera sp.]|nr:hypothetical protein [Lacunisphaera sp.]